MPKPRWTTSAQRAWLEERIPAFTESQENDQTTTVFYPELYVAWEKSFALEPPSATELEKAGGDLEKATATKKKFMETVSMVIIKYMSPFGQSLYIYSGSLNGIITTRGQQHEA
jgi:hypothetical protein